MSKLPPPVGRYLRHVLPEGQHPIVRADAVQEAEFFVNGAWKPCARRSDSVAPPGFVWDARIEMAPLLPVYVRDAYVDGEGSMRATMLGLYTLTSKRPQRARRRRAPALSRRSLVDSDGVLPGSGVTWAPADDRAAIATITDGETAVSLEFRFNERDEVVEVVGERFAEDRGEDTLRPWQVTLSRVSAPERNLDSSVLRGGVVDARRASPVLARPGGGHRL